MMLLGRRVLAVLMLVCLVLPAIQVGRGTVAAAQRAGDPAVLDIVAIPLRPIDLDVDGFVLQGGTMFTREDQAARLGATIEEIEAAGMGRIYADASALPPASEDDCMGQVISTMIYEYDDADSAASSLADTEDFLAEEGVTLIEDGLALGNGDDAMIFDSPMGECLPEGADSLRGIAQGTRDSSDCPLLGKQENCGESVGGEGLEVVFQVENLLIHMWLANNDDPEMVPAGAYDVDTETAIELAEIIEAKAFAVIDGEGAEPIEPMVLRLGDGEFEYGSSYDDYVRLDGVDFTFDDESEEEFEERIAQFGDATDVYQVAQIFDFDGVGQVIFSNTFYRFEDEDTAAGWLSEAEDRLNENPRYDDVELFEMESAYGDDSVAFTHEDIERETNHIRVYAQYGSLVIVLNIGTESGIDGEIVETLMDEQDTCMQDGACASPVPFPLD